HDDCDWLRSKALCSIGGLSVSLACEGLNSGLREHTMLAIWSD
ncbi:MAG: hypothetical protein ACJAYU_004945, partial [Bradymonadia bacterium]